MSSVNSTVVHFITYYFISLITSIFLPLCVRTRRGTASPGEGPTPLPAASCRPRRGWVENEELRAGKGKSPTPGAAQTQSGAEQLRAGSAAGVTATLCPLWAGSCTPPKGADDFLLGMEDSGSWQKLTLVFWLLVGKGGGGRFSPVGWRWPRYPQPKCCSANYQMLLHWLEITLLSIQRTDNGLLSSQNTGKKGV